MAESSTHGPEVTVSSDAVMPMVGRLTSKSLEAAEALPCC